MKFIFEIKEVKAIKKGLDLEYQLKLVTDNADVMSLGTLSADTLVEAEIKKYGNKK